MDEDKYRHILKLKPGDRIRWYGRDASAVVGEVVEVSKPQTRDVTVTFMLGRTGHTVVRPLNFVLLTLMVDDHLEHHDHPTDLHFQLAD